MSKPIIILDSSNILGLHRLLKIISKPFSKIILPPGVQINAWPSFKEQFEFVKYNEYIKGTSIKDIFKLTLNGKTQTQKILENEKSKVFQVLEKLDKHNYLISPDFNQWCDEAEMLKLCDKERFQSNKTQLQNSLLLDLISLNNKREKPLRITFQDVDAIACAYSLGLMIDSHNIHIKEFLEPSAKIHLVETSEEDTFPSDFNSNELEEYLKIVKNEEINKIDIFKKFISNDPIITTVKSTFCFLLDLIGTISLTPLTLPLSGFDFFNKIKNVSKIGFIKISTFSKIDVKNAAIIEQMINYFNSISLDRDI